MPARIETAIATLQDEEKTLLDQKSELDQKASELDSSLKRVRGALSALGALSPTRAGSRKGSTKPSPDKAAVRDAVRASLQSQPLQMDALRAEVERQLSERGYSRMGLSLRLKEVLGEDEFSESAEGRLISMQAAATLEATSPFGGH